MGVSLDGYIAGPDGDFGWTPPDEEVFRSHIDEIRESVSTAGTTAVRDDAVLADRRPGSIARRREARVGRALEAAPEGGVLDNAVGGAGQCPPGLRWAGGGDRPFASRAGRRATSRSVARRSPPGAAAVGLIDEYRARVHPVLVGGGIPFFPQRERRVDLELVESRTLSSTVVYLRYRVVR